jgi:transcriptional regulator with XRE-family HTH domain
MARSPATARTASRGMPAELGQDVGAKLRARREEHELSLRELARRLGISPSALSQIETGKSRPSVSTLYAIVTELEMSLDELFGGAPARAKRSPKPRSDAPDAERRRVQRSGTRSVIDLESGVRWERLTATPDPDTDFLYVVYEVGGSSSHGDGFIRHAGREYGLILSGTLEVTVGFDTFELGPGDSVSFDSSTPHRLRNTGSEPARGVWFVTDRGGDTLARRHGESREVE